MALEQGRDMDCPHTILTMRFMTNDFHLYIPTLSLYTETH